MADDPDPDDTDPGAVAAVLYRLPPGEFVAARTTFAKAARAAGDRAAATTIQGFGRPTQAAWVLNRLARDAPDVVDSLVELGAELAAAQTGLDAAALRELSDRRRALVREVSRQAFALAEVSGPSTSLATEVQDTLTAAVVDPAVGEALRAGTLLKAAQASGFGPAGPELAVVPPGSVRSRRPGAKTAPKTAATKTAATKTASDRGASTADTQRLARQAAQAQERERRERIGRADAALAAARETLSAARDEEKQAQEEVRILREQVRDADRALGDAGLAVREARAGVREAEKARRAAG